MSGEVDRPRNELVPGVGIETSRGGHRTQQGIQQKKGAGDLPAAFVAGGGATPVVGGQPGAGRAHDLGDLSQNVGLDPRFRGGVIESEVFIGGRQHALEVLEGRLQATVLGLHVLLPVPPPLDELPVVKLLLDQVVGDGQMDRGLGAGLRGEPEIGVGGGVGEPRVEDDQLGSVALGLDDPLCVRIEIVTGLEVGADQEDDFDDS